SFETYLAKDPTVSDAAEVKERINHLRAERFPARLLVSVENVSDASVWIDGVSKGAPGMYELSPGAHQVEVRAPTHAPARQEVTLVGDTQQDIKLSPQKDEPAATAVPPAPTVRSSVWRTIGWISAGTGAAALATSAVLDLAVLGPKINDYGDAVDRGDVS